MVQGASGTKAVTHPLCELVALKSGSMFPGGKYKAITLISTSLQISFTDFNIVLRNKDHLKNPGLKGQRLRNRWIRETNVHKERIILLLV